MQGGALSGQGTPRLKVWANSPQATLAYNNRGHLGVVGLSLQVDNLMAGAYLSTPEGVVVGSAREGGVLEASLSVGPGEQDSWKLVPNLQGGYRFAVLGSTRHPTEGAATFGKLSKAMAHRKVAFAVHLGNAVRLGDAAQMGLFREQLKALNFPTYVVPGDEDLVRGGAAAWTRTFGQGPTSFKLDQDRFLLVDNAFGRLHPSQRRWLELQLTMSRQRNERHRFVFLHRPLIDTRPKLNEGMLRLEEVKELLALFSKQQVTAVFAGHLPMYAQELRGGVRYLTSGGGGAPLARLAGSGAFHHYVEVEVSGAGSPHFLPVRVP